MGGFHILKVSDAKGFGEIPCDKFLKHGDLKGLFWVRPILS